MPGLGTILNAAGILIGGIVGLLFGKLFSEKLQEALCKVNGISVLFIGISGALEKMLSVDGGVISSGHGMLVVICLALGTLIGELLDIEGGIEKFGEWLKRKSGNAKDPRFVEGFVTASITVCVGAMAIIGSIEDGLQGDYSILLTKGILDLVTVMVMTCSMGKGCIFSVIPVVLFQGAVTALAKVMQPLMTEAALANLSLVGSILIFCVGLNLVWGKKIRAANMLPAVVLAVIFAFLPINL